MVALAWAAAGDALALADAVVARKLAADSQLVRMTVCAMRPTDCALTDWKEPDMPN